MTQLALDLDDPFTDVRPIVDEYISKKAKIFAIHREPGHIAVAVEWDEFEWTLHVYATHVLAYRDAGWWARDTTTAYASLVAA